MNPRFEDLPAALPIFPLSGVLLLPKAQLPLNIFEPRYLAMIDHALKHERLIGMIRPESAWATARSFRWAARAASSPSPRPRTGAT
jgi:Lon protease-like protein